MPAIIPRRRPFSGRLHTSVLKRRYRFARWLARVLGDGGATMVRNYLGAEFLISPGDLVGDEIAINRYEWRELAMMLAACREHRPSLFIDVGANLGLYSCVLGRAGAAPKIIAFEPDRRNFARLVENIRRNGLADVVDARPLAVGAEAGTTALLAAADDNTGLSRIEPAHPDAYPVAVVTLDDVIDLHGRAIVLKVDVEGYELGVLRGASRLLRASHGYAQIEAHGDARVAEVTAFMRDHGWQYLDRYNLDLQFERIGGDAPP
jgi:FkbM family methyltransferase